MNIEREMMSPAVRANPYPFYARLRQLGPVLPIKSPFGPAAFMMRGPTFLLTRYEDVSAALRDPRLVNDRMAATGDNPDAMNRWWIPRIFRTFANSMVGKDGADHRRLRDLVHKAFTPGMIEGLAGQVQQMVTRMLDEAERKPTSDLIADLALPLPLTVISEMMGVPEKERTQFRRVMLKLVESVSMGAARFILNYPTALQLERILQRLVDLRRVQPGDDLITGLVQAEEAGDRLSQQELLAMVFLLLLAGHETTVNLIGNGTLALLEHPDQLQRLREHPELIESAIEELLRFANPVEQITRFAREDVEIKGQRIPRGSMLLLLLASANRDEAAFENADQLDIGRSPNKHVSFGYGVHYCLGAPLSRLEGRIAMLDLVQRFPQMSLAVSPEQLRWRKSVGLHGLSSLPLHLSPPDTRLSPRPVSSSAVA
jgi:cytochrome P450